MTILFDERKTELLLEFKSIDSVTKKFKFWEEKLDMKYIFYLSITSHYNIYNRTPEHSEISYKLQDFVIQPYGGEKQIEEYNNLILEEYKFYFENGMGKKRLYVLDDLISKYSDELENTIRKEIFVKYKITEIENKIFEQESFKKNNPSDNRPDFYLHGYKRQYFNDEEPDLKSKWYSYHTLINLLNGNTLAKFRKHLDSELNLLSQPADDKPKEVTRAQKMLLLNSLGILELLQEKVPTKVKQVKLLSLLIGASPENIKKDMNLINQKNSKLHKKENYEFLVSNLVDTSLEEEKSKAEKILQAIYSAE